MTEKLESMEAGPQPPPQELRENQAAAEPPLCAFAAAAENLDEIKRAVNDAAAASGALWFSYLFGLFYLAVAVGAVTPADLFLERAVKLPFLSVELPLRAFFLLAPLLFLVSHLYTLVAFVIFSDKAKWFHRELRRQLDAAAVGDGARASEIENDLRRQLVSNIFVQFLAGPTALRQGPFGFILKLISWSTLVFAPAALLLLIQMQFLPFHDRFITWVHRIVLLVDLGAVWWLWSVILSGRFEEAQKWRQRGSRVLQSVGIGLSVVALIFSWGVATFPGEWQETHLPSVPLIPQGKHWRSLHDVVFNGPIDAVTRRRAGFFTSTLILPVFNIYEQLGIDDPAKVASRLWLFSVRGRDLRGAVFDLSNLSKVDFAGANLEEASFDRATLHTASLYCARLLGASFYQTEMQDAWLHAADLRQARMQDVRAQGARFEGAVFVGARLDTAHLQAVTLNGADMRGASLAEADLRGASLGRVDLHGECVTAARRKAAALGTDLGAADLGAANLQSAALIGAHLDRASLKGTRLGRTHLSDVTFEQAALTPDAASLAQGILLDGHGTPEALAGHAMSPDAYAYALSESLGSLVCESNTSASWIVKGLLDNGRLADTGAKLPQLVAAITSDSCAASGDLGADLKSRLSAKLHAVASRR